MILKPLVRQLVASAVLMAAASGAQATFVINLNFSGLDATQQSYFTAAKSFWEGAITGYQVGSLTGFTINASALNSDGVGGMLGSAGPTSGVGMGGFVYTTAGQMDFDPADINNMISNGSFTDVIKHEMAHVIGFGTWWTNNNVYVDGSGQFTGAAALAQYKIEFNQPGATYVPVELGGGEGTADGHWNEVDGGAGNTGITNGQGQDFKNELMTGWLNTPAYVSRTTLASFQDIGYTVNLSAVPEPATLAFLLMGLPLLAVATRRKSPR